MSDFTQVSLLVAFVDLSRFAAHTEDTDDVAVAAIVDDYYELIDATVRAAGGRVVKFIGDAGLVVFPAEAVDAGVLALFELKQGVDAFMAERDWPCRLMVKAHFGPVAAGSFGARGDKRYDVLGKTVNTTARLDSTGVALSADAFRQLSPETRKRFKKHTPPIAYIRLEDQRPAKRGRR